MPRSLRLLLAAALFSAFFASAACEDDPHDLDYLDGGDHGGHGGAGAGGGGAGRGGAGSSGAGGNENDAG